MHSEQEAAVERCKELYEKLRRAYDFKPEVVFEIGTNEEKDCV